MSKLNIHVGGSFADDTTWILNAAARAKAGEPIVPASHVSFEDWATFFRVLNPGRFALLRCLHGQDDLDARALARATGRSDRRVQADIDALVKVGLIARRAEGLVSWWDGTDADFEITETV